MVGIDLVYIPEFKKQIDLGGKTELDKAFSPSEQQDARAEHLAGLWAAKEALTKASGRKVGQWFELNISQQADGQMRATVGGQVYAVSISHHGEYAIAIAMKLKDE